jgi:hypothetical protein
MRMAPEFEKANEIYFRLGIIYKQQQKFNQSLEVCWTKDEYQAATDYHSVSNTSLAILHAL